MLAGFKHPLNDVFDPKTYSLNVSSPVRATLADAIPETGNDKHLRQNGLGNGPASLHYDKNGYGPTVLLVPFWNGKEPEQLVYMGTVLERSERFMTGSANGVLNSISSPLVLNVSTPLDHSMD